MFPLATVKCHYQLAIKDHGHVLWQICRDLSQGIALDSPRHGDCYCFTISSHGRMHGKWKLLNNLTTEFVNCQFKLINIDNTDTDIILTQMLNTDIELLHIDVVDEQGWLVLIKLMSSHVFKRVRQVLLNIEFHSNDEDLFIVKKLELIEQILIKKFGFVLTFSNFVRKLKMQWRIIPKLNYYSTWAKLHTKKFRPKKLQWLPNVHVLRNGHQHKLNKAFQLEGAATKTDAEEEYMDLFYPADLEANRLLEYITKTHIKINCSISKHMGKDEDKDGGWDICFDPILGLNSTQCLVYSIGIGEDFSFDEAMAKYGCNVFSFDPSMRQPSHKQSERVWFFDYGIADVNSNSFYGRGMRDVYESKWKVRTLEGLMAEMNHQHKPIDVLKIDIEGGEWSSLKKMLEQGILHYVKQLVFEIHMWELDYTDNGAKIREWYSILQSLERQGFRMWHWHLNPRSIDVYLGDYYFMNEPCCYEFSWINTQFNDWWL
ncbi:uncharacterized protein LOC102802408 [Saccoglossus kowalevskii]